ncbi:peptidoglycan DD-metalloendopeptidase family protein [Undibacterium sp. SXout7W]|uniref:peptidoglycan DD-metalloendopeptidase family protein n=1 Tax=Undibacterium sp. SXout7W TaxID=3413049 RepID=UPI003BF1FCF3
MKKIQQHLNVMLMGVVVVGISACSTTPNKAPVVERGVDRTQPESSHVAPAKPVVKAPESSRGTYVVKRGDTLYRIALDHGQSYSDIVAWNSLKNPNDIKVDQVLRVAPPESGSGAVAQTSTVTQSAIEVKPIVASAPVNKNAPRGDKRSYSEANLNELQKPDMVGAAVVPAAPVKTDVVPVAKPAEKPHDAPVESDGVEWMWPVDGRVVASFDDAKNKGLDIGGKMGQDIFAAGSGKVMYAGSGIRGYGNLVIIKHTSALLSAYAHNKTILVKEGQSITKGQKIAEMGNSDSDAVKLHFEIRLQGKPVDPSKYLPSR